MSAKTAVAKPAASSSGAFGILDFVVLIAMAVIALAFGAGLIVNSGIDTMAGAIAAAALFMLMASSHFVITRSLRTASVSGRLDEMEDAIEALDTDLQRIDQVEDDVARLDLLNDKVERLDNVLSDFEVGGNPGGGARLERLAGELERMQERIEALRSEVESEAKAQRVKIGADLKALEDLIKGFSRDLSTAADAASAEDIAMSVPEPEPEPVPEPVKEAPRGPDSLMRRLLQEARAEEAPASALVPEPEPEAPSSDLPVEDEEDEVLIVMTEEVTLDLLDDEPVAEMSALPDLEPEPEALLDPEPQDREILRGLDEELRGLTDEESITLMVEEETVEILVEDEPLIVTPGAEDMPSAVEAEPSPIEEDPIAMEVVEAASITVVEVEAEEPAPFDLTVEKAAPFERVMSRPAVYDYPEDDAPFDPELLPVLRKAIEANRVDLYLQPIVTLPERKLRYCDAIGRVRTDAGEILGAERYRRIAELAGLLPRIDNVMLVKSVQLLRRLGPDAKLKRIFCALSAKSLLDRDFFPELVEFLEENSALGDSLTFQLTQKAIGDLGEGELASLKTLGQLGFSFSLDQVVHLDLDFGALRDYFFRFVKIDAGTFLDGMTKARAPVPAADMGSYLDRFDLKLIVTKVSDEGTADRLLDNGVELAEGDLFSEPKPVSAEIFRELEEADAA